MFCCETSWALAECVPLLLCWFDRIVSQCLSSIGIDPSSMSLFS